MGSFFYTDRDIIAAFPENPDREKFLLFTLITNYQQMGRPGGASLRSYYNERLDHCSKGMVGIFYDVMTCYVGHYVLCRLKTECVDHIGVRPNLARDPATWTSGQADTIIDFISLNGSVATMIRTLANGGLKEAGLLTCLSASKRKSARGTISVRASAPHQTLSPQALSDIRRLFAEQMQICGDYCRILDHLMKDADVEWTIAAADAFAQLCLFSRQYLVASGDGSLNGGFVAWSWLSSETIRRLNAGAGQSLSRLDWNDGDILCIIARYGDAAAVGALLERSPVLAGESDRVERLSRMLLARPSSLIMVANPSAVDT